MVMAFIVLIAVLAIGVVMYQRGFFNNQSKPADTTNINITVPNPTAPESTQ